MYEHALLRILDGEHDPMKTDALIDFPDAPFEYAGYRRGGPHLHALQQAAREVSEALDRYATPDDPTDIFVTPHEMEELVDTIERLREVLGDLA